VKWGEDENVIEGSGEIEGLEKSVLKVVYFVIV
jgi:hypothetical protein